MSVEESWGRGFVDGYRSVYPGVTPGIPARPADYPASLSVSELDDYYYRMGYQAGQTEAQG